MKKCQFFVSVTQSIPPVPRLSGAVGEKAHAARCAAVPRWERRLRMEMNENLLYEAAFRKVEQAGQVVNFMDYAAAFDAAVACKYSRRSRCPPPSTLHARDCCVTILSMSADIPLGCSSCVSRCGLWSIDNPRTSPLGCADIPLGCFAAVSIELRLLDAQLKHGCVQRICEQVHQLWAVGHLRQRR